MKYTLEHVYQPAICNLLEVLISFTKGDSVIHQFYFLWSEKQKCRFLLQISTL
jgi:hypothetical protein